MSNSTDRVRACLSSGDLGELKGLAEDDELECKAEPYRLNRSAQQKQELAKDVAALANANGGLILVGAKTRKMEDSAREKIVETRPFPSSLVDVEQYMDILNAWITPAIDGLEVRWHPTDENGRGLMTISLPQQPKDRWPFLVIRHLDEEGKRSETVFGYFERKQDWVDHYSVEQLRSFLNTGFRYEELIREEFSALRAEVSQMLPEPVATANLEARKEQWEARLGVAVAELGLADQPAFVLSALPEEPIDLPSLFKGTDSDLYELLMRPPELRRSGFDLNTGDRPAIVKGQLRRAQTPGWKLLELWRDGTLIFVARGDEDGLCWASRNYRPLLYRINPLALIELTYLFHALFSKIAETSSSTVRTVVFRLDVRKPVVDEDNRLVLPGDSSSPLPNGTEAPDDSGSFVCRVDINEITPERAAFLLVSQVYHWFGYEDDLVPYTKLVKGETRVVDVERIRAAG